MSSALFRLGRFCFNRKWWVIAAWTALLAILITLVGVLQPKFAKDFDLPGTDGGVAMEQMTENFPEITKAQEEANTTIVVAALKPGDNLILSAFGGGYTWGAIYVKWAYDGSKACQVDPAEK